jgi:hypothetical protein
VDGTSYFHFDKPVALERVALRFGYRPDSENIGVCTLKACRDGADTTCSTVIIGTGNFALIADRPYTNNVSLTLGMTGTYRYYSVPRCSVYLKGIEGLYDPAATLVIN